MKARQKSGGSSSVCRHRATDERHIPGRGRVRAGLGAAKGDWWASCAHPVAQPDEELERHGGLPRLAHHHAPRKQHLHLKRQQQRHRAAAPPEARRLSAGWTERFCAVAA